MLARHIPTLWHHPLQLCNKYQKNPVTDGILSTSPKILLCRKYSATLLSVYTERSRSDILLCYHRHNLFRHFLRKARRLQPAPSSLFLISLSIIVPKMQVKKNFIRQKEDFVCEICGTKVVGTGYTNHCPNCLWSKHVDNFTPGGRNSACQGLMEPISVELKHGQYILTHRCLKCGKISKNKTADNDNFEAILKLSTNK